MAVHYNFLAIKDKMISSGVTWHDTVSGVCVCVNAEVLVENSTKYYYYYY